MQVQSLKAQRAAKKAAKQMQKIHRAARKTKPIPLPNSWIHNQEAKRYRYTMMHTDRYGAAASEEECLRVWHENEAAVNELVYKKNLHDNTGRFEKMLRNVRVLFQLFDYNGHSYFIDVFNQAEQALRLEFQNREASPNQRRAILKPLQDLNDVVYGLMKVTPAQVLYVVAKYGTGVQIQAYALALLEQGDDITIALFQLIEGASLNLLAKKLGMKADKLREKLLYCARCLYRIAECDEDCKELEYPVSIPELRNKQWKQWDGSRVLNAYEYARHHLVNRFEYCTGISMTGGYDKRYQRCREMLFNRKTTVITSN